MKTISVLILCFLAGPAWAVDPVGLLGAPTTVLFHDAFDRDTVGTAWHLAGGSFAIKDGVLAGGMRDGGTHPAIAAVWANFSNIILQYSFRFDGSKGFSLVFNDLNEKSVHSGHVVRMTVSPKSLTLTDDKNGLMSLKWVDKVRDPKFKDQVEKVRGETSRRFPFNWQQGQWYRLVMEVVGDEMLVSVDGKPAGYYRSPGFAHPTKTSFHFSISGRNLDLKNVTAWQAQPNPAWEQKRPGIMAALNLGPAPQAPTP